MITFLYINSFRLSLARVERDFVITFVVEKPPEGKLEEPVVERFATVAHLVQIAVAVLVARRGRVLQPARIDRVEVGRVGRVLDLRLVQCLLAAQVLGEVDRAEERVRLDLVHVTPDPFVLVLAQPQYDVHRFRRQMRVHRYAQRLPPVYNLSKGEVCELPKTKTQHNVARE